MSTYGSVDGVAENASTWTIGGEFIDPDVYQAGTNPPLSTVEDWLDEVCAFMNLALQQSWFVAPIVEATSPNAFAAASSIVNLITSLLVANRNSKGKYFEGDSSADNALLWSRVQKDLRTWISENADGLVADNVPQIPRPSLKNQIGVIVIGNH